MLNEELTILNIIQKHLKESYQSIGDNMITLHAEPGGIITDFSKKKSGSVGRKLQKK